MTNNIPDEQDIAIPSEYPSGFSTRSLSQTDSWSTEMVDAHERGLLICEREMTAKFAMIKSIFNNIIFNIVLFIL